MDSFGTADAARAGFPIAASGPWDATVALRSAALRNLLWALAIWHIALWTIVIPFFAANKRAVTVYSLASGLLTLTIPFLLDRRGHTAAACWVFVLSGSAFACLGLVFAGGIRSVIPIFQIAMSMAAFLMLGKAGVSVTLFFLAYDAALAWFQFLGGRLPVVFPLPVLVSWSLTCFALLTIAPPVWHTLRRLNDAFAKGKELEGHLRFATAQLTEAQMLAHSGNFLYDVATKTSMWSPGVFQVLGIPAPAAEEPWMFRPTQQMIRDFVAPEHRQVTEESYARLLAGQSREVEHPVRRPNGDIRHLRVRLFPETDAGGKVIRIRGTVQDETERHAYETDRQRILNVLRQLTAFQEKVREEERKRIARLVHDELGQQLVGLKMRTGFAAQLAGKGSLATAGEIDVIAKQLESAIRTVRDIAAHLRPEILDRFGLVPALEWLARQFTENHRIACVTDLHETDAAGETATIIFRAAQEALTNVAKHAGATHVELSLLASEEKIQLVVSDNGRGFDPGDVGPGSLGLAGMRERAVAAGGSLTILRRGEGGTVLRLVLPLAAEKGGNP